MGVWGSIGNWKDPVLAAARDTPPSWVNDMAVDVAVSYDDDMFRLLIGPQPPSGEDEWLWQGDVYLDRANLEKLRDRINVALGGGR